MSFLSRFFRIFESSNGHPFGRVEFDETKISYTRSSRVESIAWSDLAEVSIVTTDEGPFQEDVYFLLSDDAKKKGCAVPQRADGSQLLFERLQTLPDFNNEAAISAMGSTANDRFVCWRRKTPGE